MFSRRLSQELLRSDGRFGFRYDYDSEKSRFCPCLLFSAIEFIQYWYTNEQIIQNECRSTRFYLVWLIFAIVILIFYYTITPFTLTIISESPSSAKYSTLIIDFQSQKKSIIIRFFPTFFTGSVPLTTVIYPVWW